MDEPRTPTLDERFRSTLDETASPLTLLRASSGLGIVLLALLLLGIGESDATLRALYLIWAGALLLLLLLVLLLGRRYRCTMSPAGVSLGKAQLAWADVRTAAVIRRSQLPPIFARFPNDAYFILLSTNIPEGTVDKWHFLMEAPDPRKELRIPFTRKRRAAVEHYLGMALPEVRL